MIRAKQLTFLIDHKTTSSKWFPQIKMDGKWSYFVDNSSNTGMVECDTEIEAWKYAAMKLLVLEESE